MNIEVTYSGLVNQFGHTTCVQTQSKELHSKQHTDTFEPLTLSSAVVVGPT